MSNETFEKVYPRYPFSPLVTLGIELSKWFAASAESERANKPARARRPAPACR